MRKILIMRTILTTFVLFAAMFAATAQHIPFVESFENGIAKWNNLSAGGTVEATTIDALAGNKSLHITGTGANAGLSIDFIAMQNPTVLSYYVKVSAGEGGVVAMGNGHTAANAAFYGEITGGSFVVTGSSGATTLCAVPNDKWIRVEVRNFNYTDGTYDVFIDGILRGKGMDFAGTVPSISTLDVYNETTGSEAWWDAFYVGTAGLSTPDFDGTEICANAVSEVTVAPAVALDSAGFYMDSTWFEVGPVAADSMINFRYPYIESTWATNNSYAMAWGGNMFNITAENDIVIYGFDLNPGSATAGTAKVYFRPGTYVGFETSNAGWILLDSVAMVQNGSSDYARVDLSKSLTLQKGQTYGIYICTSVGMYYTNGDGTNEVISNNDLTCQFGCGGSLFNVNNFPRVWNGRIYYKVAEEHKEKSELTTMFTGTNSYAGNMFDLQVKNDIVIDSLDVNILGDGWVKMYLRNGTCVGNNTSNVGWWLVDSVQVVAAGSGFPTKIALSKKVLLQAGNLYGFYICNEYTMNYTNIIAGVNDVYIDSNVVLTGYYGGTNTFNCINPRMWNGTLYYSLRNADEVVPGAEISTNAGMARGFYFQATSDFRIIGAMVPTNVPGNQSVAIVRLDSVPPAYPSVTNDLVNLAYRTGVPNGAIIPFDVFIAKGDYVGVYAEGDYSSYCANDTLMVVLGDTIARYRSGMQYDLTTSQMHDVWSEPSSLNISRVQLFIEPVTVHGGQDSALIDIQSPSPNLGADGDYCVQNIVTLDPGTFASYDWSTMETGSNIDVDTTGVALNTPIDVWVTVTDQYGCTGSDTITITFVDCTGIDEEEITLSVYPNPSDDVFYLKADNVQDEMLIQVFSLDGRLVKQQLLNETFGNIDMSNELPGVYSIRITIKDQVKEMRVVLQ